MNIYLIQVIGNFVNFLVVTVLSLFGVLNSVDTEIKNSDVTKNSYVENQTINYETIYQYNSKIPSNISKVLVKGEDGIVYVNNYDKTQIVLKEVINEVIEVGTGNQGYFYGRLTGYGPDCPGCSPVGNVSCRTREGNNHSLINNGTTYVDQEFGEVRILAAATSAFPCGTIIAVDNGILAPFYAVVLDTGYDMRNAWSNGNVWFDLAFSSQASVTNVSNSQALFSVQRWGW
ncbi:MAG: hypothetical protein HFI87_07680 [Bacilli bacterium]|nr:hypothetical protein [Bacilli bacterium]